MKTTTVSEVKSILSERDLCESKLFNIRDLRLKDGKYIWKQDGSDCSVSLTKQAEQQLCSQLRIPYSFFDGVCNDQLKEDNFNTITKDLYVPQWSTFTQVFVTDSDIDGIDYDFKSFSMPFTYVKSSDLFDKAVSLFSKDQDFTSDEIEIMNFASLSDKVEFTLLSPKPDEVSAGDFVQVGLEIDFPDRRNSSLDLNGYLYRLICTNGAISPFASNLRRKLKGDNSVTVTNFLNSFSHVFTQAASTAFSALDHLKQLQDITFTGDISKIIKSAMKEYNIPKKYFDLLLGAYNAEPMPNQYGLLNAFSRAANSDKLSIDESRRLQTAAGRGLLMPSLSHCDKCFSVIS